MNITKQDALYEIDKRLRDATDNQIAEVLEILTPKLRPNFVIVPDYGTGPRFLSSILSNNEA